MTGATEKVFPGKIQVKHVRLKRTRRSRNSLNSQSMSLSSSSESINFDKTGISIRDDLKHVLKPHQVAGVEFIWSHIVSNREPGCLLADFMGLGKTLQVITALEMYIRKEAKGRLKPNILLVTPAVVVRNWKQEIEKWLPGKASMQPLTLSSTGSTKEKTIKTWASTGGILILSYEMFRSASDGNCLLASLPELVVLDEGHRIRSQKARLSEALSRIRTRRRIVLTGYPLQTKLVEYWTMMDFVQPDVLGSLKDFRDRFEKPILAGQRIDSNSKDVITANKRILVLQHKLSSIVLRRGSDLLEALLPKKREYVVWCKPSRLQERLYAAFLSWRKTKVDRLNSLLCYNQLKLLTNHPDILKEYFQREMDQEKSREGKPKWPLTQGDQDLDPAELSLSLPSSSEDNYKGPSWASELINSDYNQWQLDNSGKIMVFISLLWKIHEVEDGCIVFSRSIDTLDFLEKLLQNINRGCFKQLQDNTTKKDKILFEILRMDGSTPSLQREKLINRFNCTSENPQVFLISTKAGGEGINLVGGNRVIMFDLSWNPCDDVQAIRRCFRFGQIKPVYVYRLITTGCLENVVFNRQLAREGLANTIVDKKRIQRRFSTEDLKTLFSSIDSLKAKRCDGSKMQRTRKLTDPVLNHTLTTVGMEWIENIEEYHLLLSNDYCKVSADFRQLALAEYKREMDIKASLDRILQENPNGSLTVNKQAPRIRRSSAVYTNRKIAKTSKRRIGLKRARTSISVCPELSARNKTGMFSSVAVWLVTMGISKLQKDIICRQIILHGGFVSLTPWRNANFIVTSLSLYQLRAWIAEKGLHGTINERNTIKSLNRRSQRSLNGGIPAVKLSFITESLRLRKIQGHQAYKLANFHLLFELNYGRTKVNK